MFLIWFLFIYGFCFLFPLHWVLAAAHGFRLVVTGRLLYGRHIESRALGLSSCRARAVAPSKWDPSSQPGIRLTSPASEAGFSTTGPPGKFLFIYFWLHSWHKRISCTKKAKAQKSNRVESHSSKHCCSFIQEIWVSSPFTYYFHNSRFISLCTKMLYTVCCCDGRTIIWPSSHTFVPLFPRQ